MNRRIWVVLSIAYAAGIFVLSSLPLAGSVVFPGSGIDKLIHAAEYALLFLIVRRAVCGKTGLSLLITVPYAGSDELHQAFVPGRHAGIDDFAADLAGILLLVALSALLHRFPLLARFRRRILSHVVSRKGD